MVLYRYLIRSEDGARPGEVAGEWRCDATRTLNEVRWRTLWTVLDALRGLRPCTRADKSTISHKTSERWSVDRSRGFPIVRLGEPVRSTKLRSINPRVLGYNLLVHTWISEAEERGVQQIHTRRSPQWLYALPPLLSRLPVTAGVLPFIRACLLEPPRLHIVTGTSPLTLGFLNSCLLLLRGIEIAPLQSGHVGSEPRVRWRQLALKIGCKLVQGDAERREAVVLARVLREGGDAPEDLEVGVVEFLRELLVPLALDGCSRGTGRTAGVNGSLDDIWR
jgi:hypothetical protein